MENKVMDIISIKPIERSDMLFCGYCKFAIARFYNYCPKCGKRINWEEPIHE